MMGDYAVYVYSAWIIVYVAMGVRVWRDRARLVALQKKVTHDE